MALLFLLCTAFREASPFILNFSREDHGTTVYFIFYNPDANNNLQKLTDALGKPASNTSGFIEWKNIHIDGIAHNVTITIKDGILTHDTVAHQGCWVPFKNEADKKERLNRMIKNQDRETYIYFKDEHGNQFISNGVTEQRLQVFLDKKLRP